MPDYSFVRPHVQIVNAFDAHIKTGFPDVSGYDTSGENVVVSMPRTLTVAEQATLASLVGSYADPTYWLDLQRTDTIALKGPNTSSADPVFMQSFIVALPDNLGFTGECAQSMKTVVRYTPANLNAFAAWDSNADPVRFTLSMQDYSNSNYTVKSVTDDTSSLLGGWVAAARAGSNTADPVYKTIQMFGLNPGSDAIWNLYGSISNSNVSASINGMQKLYYSVTRTAL